ncbi:uncharacterized protein C8Q71DRAFT_773902 [Rhodofomes roseus]|uniref:F-box domain-containing protein n=1 Tax=Rhodofomes roseus TaxID=34475 RepID=A0ABQ8K8K9_9APHY|nr:uncharacterized protein C8Q71DRAFT_773902 [Rhodofomes roseus]KAH9833534.1 hypothetical protein C8Q71DRAFT_773902 [Rhodofomes roseus]
MPPTGTKSKAVSSDGAVANIRVRPKKVPGRQGGLKAILNMPMDVIAEILSQCHPRELLTLARTTKWFRSLLMRRNSAYLWREALRTVQGLPPCPPELAEPAWVALAFSPYCTNCGEGRTPTVCWAFLARYCKGCRSQLFTNRHTAWSNLPQDKVMPYRSLPKTVFLWTKLPGSSATCYTMSQLVEVVDAWIEFKSSGPGEASRDQFIAERSERVKQRLAFTSLCEAWARVQDLARDSELADIKQERFEEILSRLRALGWGPELDFIKDKGYVPLADHQIVKVPRSLTDQAWNNVYDKLIGCMQDVRVDLANHSVEKLKVNFPIRWKIMERALRQLSLREHTEYQRKYGLVAADIALTKEYRDILGAPAGKTVTEATFLALGEQADSIVKDWLFRTREQLREVLLKEIEPPQNIDPLELATTVFVCGSCPPGFQFHFFPDICRAVCQRSSKAFSRGDTYEDLVVGHCGPLPFRVSGCLRACHPTTRMREVIQFCGKNPDAVTAKEMDELDVRLVRDDIIMTWRCAMMEGLQDPHALNTWRLATFEETLKSQEHERRILAKGGQWYCMRCEPSPYLETLHDVEDHFRIKHGTSCPALGTGDIEVEPWPHSAYVGGIFLFNMKPVSSSQRRC